MPRQKTVDSESQKWYFYKRNEHPSRSQASMSLKQRVETALVKKAAERDPSIIGLSHKVIALEVKTVNSCVPRRLLLFCVNLLDRRVPQEIKASIADGIGKLPEDVRSSILLVADEYVPPDVDNSWKFCSVVAGICKYVPEKIIPMCSAERWERIRFRYHIPTLINGTQPRGPSLN